MHGGPHRHVSGGPSSRTSSSGSATTGWRRSSAWRRSRSSARRSRPVRRLDDRVEPLRRPAGLISSATRKAVPLAWRLYECGWLVAAGTHQVSRLRGCVAVSLCAQRLVEVCVPRRRRVVAQPRFVDNCVDALDFFCAYMPRGGNAVLEQRNVETWSGCRLRNREHETRRHVAGRAGHSHQAREQLDRPRVLVSVSRRLHVRPRLLSRWLAAIAVLAIGLSACAPVKPPPPPPPPDRPLPPNQPLPLRPVSIIRRTGWRVACENTATGNPAPEWDVSGSGDPSIQGFATSISVNRGETVHFKIDTDASLYHLEIYRMGWYGGAGRGKSRSRARASCSSNSHSVGSMTTAPLDCGNWSESAAWQVPANATSGIYFAKLVRDRAWSAPVTWSSSCETTRVSPTSWSRLLTRLGRPTTITAASVSTRAARVASTTPRSRSVKPAISDSRRGHSWLFYYEYPMVRWLESNGYDLSYFTGVDSDARGGLLKNHKVFLSSGHDEYWSGGQRANAEAALASGVNLAFFTGNTSLWKTRGKTTIARSFATRNQLTSSTRARFGQGCGGSSLQPALGRWAARKRVTGTLYAQNSELAMNVPAEDGKMRFWRNTSIAQQAPGQVATLPPATLGSEWDEDIDTGGGVPSKTCSQDSSPPAPRSAPRDRSSSTTIAGPGGLEARGPNPEFQAPGSNVDATATTDVVHHMTLYRADSGALVFSSGTLQWAWGLDENHDRPTAPADLRMQQATVNLFADMGVQPSTHQPGLVAATKSTDSTPPTSLINPVPPAQVDQTVIITGTAEGRRREGRSRRNLDGRRSDLEPGCGQGPVVFRYG